MQIKLSLCLSILLFSYSLKAQELSTEQAWLDKMHRSIADTANDTALWFDDFFALKEFNQLQKAKGQARIRLGWEPRSRKLNELESRFSLKLKLPNLKNRVDLILSDYDDEQPTTGVQASRGDQLVEENFTLALRWRVKPSSGLSHRIGIGRRLQPFVKSRYRKNHELAQDLGLRWETSIYYYSRDGFGANFKWQLDYNLSEKSLLRFDNQFYYRDSSNDWLWQHSLRHLYQLDEKTAYISGLYIQGLSQPNYQIEEYLSSVRWRKNALREWLYFEVEPFILWHRDEHFSASFGIALRVEGFFG